MRGTTVTDNSTGGSERGILYRCPDCRNRMRAFAVPHCSDCGAKMVEYESVMEQKARTLYTDSEQKCLHEKEDIWPSEDEGIWYLINREEDDRTYWCENDAVYVLLRKVTKEFVCTGCGEERTIETAVEVGGEEGLKRKSEMSDEELEQFREEVHCGGFANGWPEHRKHLAPDGGRSLHTDSEQ